MQNLGFIQQTWWLKPTEMGLEPMRTVVCWWNIAEDGAKLCVRLFFCFRIVENFHDPDVHPTKVNSKNSKNCPSYQQQMGNAFGNTFGNTFDSVGLGLTGSPGHRVHRDPEELMPSAQSFSDKTTQR